MGEWNMDIGDIITNIIAIASLVVSILVARKNSNREKKIKKRDLNDAIFLEIYQKYMIREIPEAVAKIKVSQLKFLYPLKTLVFPAFSPPRFGPFPSFFPLREEMRETFFRPSLQPYPAALRKFAWPLWWRGRKCSSWYLHQNVPAAPAHPWVRLREREGWSYMYASTDGNENHPYPRSSFGSIGIRC